MNVAKHNYTELGMGSGDQLGRHHHGGHSKNCPVSQAGPGTGSTNGEVDEVLASFGLLVLTATQSL